MKIKAIKATNVKPITNFQADNLSDTIVLAGPNGVGKTRLVDALIGVFRSPVGNSTVQLTIEATSDAEQKAWNKSILDTVNDEDARKLITLLQQSKRRSRWQSSVINFESDRSIQQVGGFAPSWGYADPFEELIGWSFGWEGLRNRFRDTLDSIFRKVSSRRQEIARKAENLFNTSSEGAIMLNRTDFPDPLDPFKHAFRQLLAPKELLDAEPERQQLEYRFDGATFPITGLSSGEKEVVNVVFDFILRNPQDSIVIFSKGSPESWRTPSNSLQKNRSKSRRNASIPQTSSTSIQNSVTNSCKRSKLSAKTINSFYALILRTSLLHRWITQ